jgi:hypothetical protein
MILMLDINTHCPKFSDEFFDLTLSRISSHISNIFVVCPAKDFEDGTSQSICDCHFGFVRRPEPKSQGVVFGAIERSTLLCSPLGRLDEDFS